MWRKRRRSLFALPSAYLHTNPLHNPLPILSSTPTPPSDSPWTLLPLHATLPTTLSLHACLPRKRPQHQPPPLYSTRPPPVAQPSMRMLPSARSHNRPPLRT